MDAPQQTPDDLIALIDDAWERRKTLNPGNSDEALLAAVDQCLDGLESGAWRVAESGPDGWQVKQWLKKAVLLSFRIRASEVMQGGFTRFYDKLPLRWSGPDARTAAEDLRETGARIVPPATVRRGAYIAPDAVLMPCYVNVGARIGRGTMVDTWATVGSCAQVGDEVHISGGVGIGGVLEPVQASPTIIEDGCFIGARSEIVEGVIVERGSVVSMGVYLGQSTRIYNRESGEITRGRVPAGSVVVPGALPAEDGSHSLYCAVIVKQVDEKTRARTSVNELLRDAG